jgi:hypothetical protein
MNKYRIRRRVVIGLAVIAGLWLVGEIGIRLYVDAPLEIDFYSSIPREEARARQAEIGVRSASGIGWVHLGWIADPDAETYRVERRAGGAWEEVGRAGYGSLLVRGVGGTFRVVAIEKGSRAERVIGEAEARPAPGDPPPLYVPRIAGPWQTLFRPSIHGSYINDHTVFRDAEGSWRVVGITDLSDGDYNSETFFAVGVGGQEFPPAGGMAEADPVADFGTLAWAPHVITAGGRYHMFWSPHALHQMSSPDGITWEDHAITMPAPAHRFFRDPMVLQVAEGQWLLYTTARGRFFSQVDIYQSFDLEHWQYIRTALASGPGSERNAPFASMESPFVTVYEGRCYLLWTYNNNTAFWHGLLLPLHVWINPATYNETLVMHSDNPYDFGAYRGRGRTPGLIAELEAHAPEIIAVPEQDAWYITTAGWPWVATLTSGEVAVAPLAWDAAR